MKNLFKIATNILLLLSMLCMIACNTPKETDTTKKPEEPAPYPPIGKEINIPVELTVYDYNKLGEYINMGERTITDFDSTFPIEYAKQLDATHKCVVYRVKTSEDIEKEVYVYIIFQPVLHREETVWVNVNSEYYLATKQYSLKDFSFLEKDLTMEDFDFDCSIFIDCSSRYIRKVSYFTSTASLLLEEGVLLISFKAPYEKDPNAHYSNIADPYDLRVVGYQFFSYGSTNAPYYISVINCPNIFQDN